MQNKKRDYSMLIKLGLVTVMSLGLIYPSFYDVQAQGKEVIEANIYPKPVSTNFLSQDGMKLVGEANLVVHGEQKQATKERLKTLLTEHKITYTESEELDSSKANIILSSEKDDYNKYVNSDTVNQQALEEAGGYVLYSSDDRNSNGEIIIVGADTDGAFNAVITLKQILNQGINDKFAECSISDYPSIKQRGIVEGFYGYPWSQEGRLKMIEDIASVKMNMYIYAPKDDPYHREKWKELYPEDKANEIKNLVTKANQENVEFCWTIHPGQGFDYDKQENYEAIIKKYNQLYSLGVRRFGVFFDDITGWQQLEPTQFGKYQAQVIDYIEEWITQKGDVKPIVTVPTLYHNGENGFKPLTIEKYVKELMNAVSDDGIILWTGQSVFSKVTKDIFDVPRQKSSVDRDVAAWWNHPVNDMTGEGGRLYLGELGTNVDVNIDNLSGFFMNPMPQDEASKVPIFSGADYSWNPKGFDSHTSWKNAINQLIPDADEAFQRFASNIGGKSGIPQIDESQYMKSKIDSLSNALKTNTNLKKAATDLKEEFARIKSDLPQLKKIKNQAMLDDCKMHINAYEALAESMCAAMDAIIAKEESNNTEFVKNYFISKQYYNKSLTFKVKSLIMNGNGATMDNIAGVGELYLKPLLKNVLEQYESIVNDSMNVVDKATLDTNIDELTGQIQFENKVYTSETLKATLSQGDYIGIKLSKPTRFETVSLLNVNGNLTMESSLDGKQWKKVNVTVNDGKIEMDSELLDASYIRFINENDQKVELSNSILSANVFQNNIIKNISFITEAEPTNGTIRNMSDGNYDSTCEFGKPVLSFTIDLEKSVLLNNIHLVYKSYSDFKTRIEISNDQKEWKDLGTIDHKQQSGYGSKLRDLAKLTDVNQKAQYIKVNFVGDKAINSFKQVAEVIINKDVDYTNEPSELPDLIETSFEAISESNAFDSNINTALTAKSISKDDSLVYTLTTITDVDRLMIAQGEDSITKAKVQVQLPNGTWQDVGVLDKTFTELDINQTIDKVRLVFDGLVSPKIYEILVTEFEELESADYTKVDEAIAKVKGLDKNLYKDFSVVEKAVEKVVRGLDISKQEEVDGYAKAIEDAIEALVYKDADYTKVDEAIAKVKRLDKSLYKNFSDVEKAVEKVIRDLDITKQEEVNAMAKAIHSAIDALVYKDADYTKVDEAIAKIPSDLTLYTEASVKVLNQAKDAVVRNKNITEQATVDAYAKAIIKAIAELEKKTEAVKPADKDALHKKIESVDKLDLNIYEAESVKKLQTVYDAAKKVLANEKAFQSEVDNAVKALDTAIKQLVKKPIIVVDPEEPNNDLKSTIKGTQDDILEAIFTKEEIQNIKNGTKYNVDLNIKKLSNQDVNSDIKEMINKTLKKNQKLGMYLDIQLFVDYNNQVRTVTKLNKSLIITMDIPQGLLGKEKYYIIREHDGKVTELKDLDNQPNTITFETDQFSTYALVYEEKEALNVITGDHTQMMLWLVLLAGTGIVFIFQKKKKHIK